ncbi:putative repeat protein (TIGR03943 family) [Krasilnikovia cinnamomea]|uniref:Putative repeat protein (TIGR03943 family) n=1 Tax=Krasilnikovia cinnamomea TaxID=349313 RepID=A0A4Q7ZQN7_9ACTN|nr:TIGR03943 family protein [Krasilnikovia cinnamomea]RZU53442.1 putative repeat protein (TIGR03943 family) [Krasilnikovia cinnamomea]
MNRLSQAVVMLLFGGAIVKATLTDIFLRYVKEGLRPFLIAAGALLIAAAVMTIWYELRPGSRPDAGEHEHDGHGHDGHEHDGHGHGSHEPRVGWLLILPVLGLLLVTPPALGSYSAGQAGSVAVAPADDANYPPLPAGDPVPIGLLDYATRAIFDDGKTLTGRTVQLTGFVAPGPDGEPMLARMVLNCCAADGRPIKVGLAGDTSVNAPADTWVQVVGVYSDRVGKDPVNQADVAYLAVQSWQQISEPKQPYE